MNKKITITIPDPETGFSNPHSLTPDYQKYRPSLSSSNHPTTHNNTLLTAPAPKRYSQIQHQLKFRDDDSQSGDDEDDQDQEEMPCPRRITTDKQPASVTYPVVEFQEFTVDNQTKLANKTTGNSQVKASGPLRKFEIQVPEVRFQSASNHKVTQSKCENDFGPPLGLQTNLLNKFALNKNKAKATHHQYDSLLQEYVCKEPPAPSKGSTKGKVFIFPTPPPAPAPIAPQLNMSLPENSSKKRETAAHFGFGAQDNYRQFSELPITKKSRRRQKLQIQTNKNNERSSPAPVATTTNKNIVVEDKCSQHVSTIENLNKELDKCRQDIMVKDSQIQLLQKIITQSFMMRNNVPPLQAPVSYSPYSNNMPQGGLSRQSPKNNGFRIHNPNTASTSTFCDTQKILLEKDKNIEELTQRLQKMSQLLKNKNEEIAKCRYQISRLEGMLEGYQHSAFLFQKRRGNEKLTETYYEVRKEKRRSSTMWEEPKEQLEKHPYDIISKNNQNQSQRGYSNKASRFEGSGRVEQVRVNEVTQNRWDHPEGSPNRGEWHAQTTKHRPKATFDFKMAMSNNSILEGMEFNRKKNNYL